ncbi:hypothetical protein PG996_013876 [Apiospora saccharicola]|uniref:Uncharacterized protein n=1 Tax=Apiospora saccharicola TaxID=335842 RepID=A0ABR1TGS9_9PEZI
MPTYPSSPEVPSTYLTSQAPVPKGTKTRYALYGDPFEAQKKRPKNPENMHMRIASGDTEKRRAESQDSIQEVMAAVYAKIKG